MIDDKKHYPCFDCPSMCEYFPACKDNCGKLMRYYRGEHDKKE